MFSTMLVCCAFIGSGPEGGTASSDSNADRPAYEQARKEAGRDPAAHVRLALWCESHGMTAERMKHLAMAVMYDPSNPLARGLMGLVDYKGKWGPPEDTGRRIKEDPAYRELIDEYLARRAQATHKAESQMRLATWCEEKGLKAEAMAHYNVVVQLDPKREAAWRRLGYRKSSEGWVKPDEAATRKLEAEAQRRADKSWRPRLEGLRQGIESADPSRKARAEQALADVNDPRALPMIWAVFVNGGKERSQLAAVQMLGQIDGPRAAAALATMALFFPDGAPRSRAVETLGRRDPRDIVGRLIALIRKPYTYKVRPIYGMGSVGELFVEGETSNVYRAYRSRSMEPEFVGRDSVLPSLVESAAVEADSVSPDDALRLARVPDPQFDLETSLVAEFANQARTPRDRLLVTRLDLIRRDNLILKQQLAADIQEIEAMNARIVQLNDRVLPVLGSLTGQDLGAEPDQWKAWWSDQVGMAFQKQSTADKPTFTEVIDSPSWNSSNSCFAAGTPVQTVDGPRAIESIQVGDRVLSQDPTTGRLSFRPVLAVRRNRPAATLRLAIEGETIVATGIHRFWKAGKGWTMARELKPGDRLRVVGGTAEVRSIRPEATQPVYNLDVAEDRDFFVGTRGLLVHDFSFVQSVPAPFDREPELTSLATPMHDPKRP